LIVQRDGKRVRLFTRNGHDWTDRYPLIVESALRNKSSSFVIDGEAVLLGVDCVSDFDGLHSRKAEATYASVVVYDAEPRFGAVGCQTSAPAKPRRTQYRSPQRKPMFTRGATCCVTRQ
jgi:ATP dependent DNA ligase domain